MMSGAERHDDVRGERLETLIVARASSEKTALGELIKPLQRFAPATLTPAAWREKAAAATAALREQGVLDAEHRLADAGELARRIGRHSARGWAELSDRVLPALALGIAGDDARSRARLDGRDAWAAAIVGRALGLWRDGPPPSLASVCDALVWRELSLPGAPKRCPPELRALFVQRRLGGAAGPPERRSREVQDDGRGREAPERRSREVQDDGRGREAPERLVRVLAAREVDAPRPELRALRDALVRSWLAGRMLGAGDDAAPAARVAAPAASDARPAFAADVLGAAARVVDGRFGDRKVFVSAVWDELRRDPRWADLALAAFKDRLVAAHRAGALALARADLVAAMDPALVAASEIAVDGASFHFLVKEAAP